MFGKPQNGPRRMVFALNRNRERAVSFSLREDLHVGGTYPDAVYEKFAIIESIKLLDDDAEQGVEPADFRIFSSDR
jgi:hypothetical protein